MCPSSKSRDGALQGEATCHYANGDVYVGAWDAGRRCGRGVLHAANARAVLLDLTGVPLLDEQGASGMIGAARAARLLGLQVVLTGMQADVARDLADLDLHMDGIETARSLENGIRLALERVRRDEGRHRFAEEEYEA